MTRSELASELMLLANDAVTLHARVVPVGAAVSRVVDRLLPLMNPGAVVPPQVDPPPPAPAPERPHHGRFDWEVRSRLPGLDDSAVRDRAAALGYLAPPPDGEDDFLPGFIKHAFAAAYDRAVLERLGMPVHHNVLAQPPDNLELLLAYAYALCDRLDVFNAPNTGGADKAE